LEYWLGLDERDWEAFIMTTGIDNKLGFGGNRQRPVGWISFEIPRSDIAVPRVAVTVWSVFLGCRSEAASRLAAHLKSHSDGRSRKRWTSAIGETCRSMRHQMTAERSHELLSVRDRNVPFYVMGANGRFS